MLTSSDDSKDSGDFIESLDPKRKTFYVKKGRPYRGIYFTLDLIIPFAEADCINDEVTRAIWSRFSRNAKILKISNFLEYEFLDLC